MKRDELLAQASQNLSDIETFKRTRAYDLLIKPLQEELLSLKSAYDCKTLQEIATLKGKKEGLSFVLETIEKIVAEGERAREESDRLARQKQLDNLDIDSTSL